MQISENPRLSMIFSFGLSVLIILVGCNTTIDPADEQITPSQISTPSLTSTPTIRPSIPSEPSWTPEPPTRTPPPNFWPSSGIIPEVILRCPDPRYIQIEDMGLSNETGIVLSLGYQKDSRVGIIAGSDPIPKLIPEITFTGGIEQIFMGLSPNGKWAVYRVGDPLIGGTEVSIWIITLDGSQQRLIKKIIIPTNYSAYIHASWHSNDQLYISSSIKDSEEKNTRYKAYINILTLDETPYLSGNRPEWVEFMVYPSIYNSSAPYLIYYGISPSDYDAGLSTTDLYLYDRDNNTAKIAFPWLEDPITNPYFFVDNASLTVNENGQATVVVFRPYGFDIAIDLELDKISNNDDYEQIVNKVLLEEIITDGLHQWVNNDSIGFFLNSVWPSTPKETPFYVYDWKNNILVDYCLTAAELPLYGHSLDLGGNYIARWDGATSVLVLSLETGVIARIRGVGFLGWVEMESDG